MPMTILRKGRAQIRRLSIICFQEVIILRQTGGIELYTDRKDPGAEALVETVLDDAGIFYNKSEAWIQSEKLYEVLYSMEL